MKRSESVGIASLVVAIIILGFLIAFLSLPSIAIYLPGTLVGLGSIISVIILAAGLLGKE